VDPSPWQAFVDGPPPLPDSPYAGAAAVLDTDLPAYDGTAPLRVLVSTGAGGIAGPVALCERRSLPLAAVDVALRDEADPAGNAARVLAACPDLPVPLHVRVAGAPTPLWLAALDVLAAAPVVVAVPLEAPVEAWVDAALDRELPVSLLGGSTPLAVEALRTTARLWGDPDDLVAARRWCVSWLAPSPTDAIADLEAL
jgi:hypothetical protein